MTPHATLPHGSTRLDFQALFEAAPTPYLVLTPDFIIVAANEARLRVTNTRREEIIGRPLFDVFPDNPQDPAATGVANLRASLQRVLRDGRADIMAIQKYDIPVPGSQGAAFEERFWSPLNTPVFDATGRLAYIIHRVEDVTDFVRSQVRAERMESEIYDQAIEIQNANRHLREANQELDRRVAERTEELSREREYLRSLLMVVPVPVSVMIGPEHHYRLENDAHQELIAHRPILGKPFREAFPEVAEMVPVLDRIYRTGNPYRMERQRLVYDKHNDGRLQEAYFSFSWHALYGPQSEVEGVIAATMDVTEQVRIEERLRESEAFYRIAVEAARVGTWDIDPDNWECVLSPRMAEMMGLTTERQPIPASVWEERVLEEDRESVRKAILDAVSLGRVYEVKFRVRRPNGEIRTLYARGEVTFAEAGKPMRLRGATIDLSNQVQVQEELRVAKDTLSLAIEGAGEGLWECDLRTGRGHYSPRLKQIIGYTDEELPDAAVTWSARVHPEDRERVEAAMRDYLEGRTPTYRSEYRVRCRLGRYKWVLSRGVVTARDEASQPLRMSGMISDISERKEADDRIWHLANFDTLTGLPNRRLFRDRLDNSIKLAGRNAHAIALLFIDLDRFKQINDSLGHDVGDLLLVQAAQRIRSAVREADTVARLGGDEFTVMVEEVDGRTEMVERIADKILRALAAPFELRGEPVSVSGSIGIALYPLDAGTPEDLMRKADQAMYSSKQAGKNRFAYFTQEMDDRAHRRHRVMNHLQRALDERRLELYYQPVVEMTTGRVAKAEALIRWNDPEAGRIEPSLFIPLAEESGLIGQIGDWVFHQAVLQSSRWSELLGAPFQIGINVSPVQFHAPRQDSWVEFMRREAVPAHLITLEITEGLLMQTSLQVSNRLMAYKSAGMEVAIDDFGTGYSSMAYLKRFDIDYLKIDRSFVRDMVADATHRTIAETIIVMAHKLGLKVIAEGVETREQLQLLSSAGCDFAQGFLFSPPRPAVQFEQMLSSDWGVGALRLH